MMYFPFHKIKSAAVWAVVIAVIAVLSCVRNEDGFSIIPPPTYPLSRPCVGYGVVVPSYTNLSSAPESASFSQGYMRRGTIVKVLERKAVQKQDALESWVFVEGGYKGWLNENEVHIYDNEAQALTASGEVKQ